MPSVVGRVLVWALVAVSTASAASGEGRGEASWGHALYFSRGVSHEAVDFSDGHTSLVSVPQTFCHGNHCDYYRQPLEFVCGHRDHVALATGAGGGVETLGDAVRIRAADTSGGLEQVAIREGASKEEVRRLIRQRAARARRLDVGEWARRISLSPSDLLASLGIDTLLDESNVSAATSLSSSALEREVLASIKSFTNKRRYFPLTEEELNEEVRTDLHFAVREAEEDSEDAAERLAHQRHLMGAFEGWQAATVSRFDPRDGELGGGFDAPTYQGVGHPLHLLRFIAHSTGGTYATAGNRRLPMLLARRERDRAEESIAEAVGEPPRASIFSSSSGLPAELDVSVEDWVCAPRRPALLEGPMVIEHIHILCAASRDVHRGGGNAVSEDTEGLVAGLDWHQMNSVDAGSVWTPSPRGQTVFGEYHRGPLFQAELTNRTIAYHCSLHYHIVNYGDPSAKFGAVVLGIATIVFVIVMLFFVGGKWYQEKVASYKTRKALRKLDEEAWARQRRRDEERGIVYDEDDDEDYELPLDISAVNAMGSANSQPAKNRGRGPDPDMIRALQEHADAAQRGFGMRRRYVATSEFDIGGDGIEPGGAHQANYFRPKSHRRKGSASRDDPVLMAPSSGVGGGLYHNPQNLTLGDLLGAGSSLNFGGSGVTPLSAHHRRLHGAVSGGQQEASMVAMPWDIGVTPRRVPSENSPSRAPEIVQTVAIDEF